MPGPSQLQGVAASVPLRDRAMDDGGPINPSSPFSVLRWAVVSWFAAPTRAQTLLMPAACRVRPYLGRVGRAPRKLRPFSPSRRCPPFLGSVRLVTATLIKQLDNPVRA